MRPFIAVALAIPLAVVALPVVAQEGVLPLDSAVVAALTPLRARIDQAGDLRLRGPLGVSVLVAPRLLPSGLGYGSLVGPDPRLDGREFVLQTRGRAAGTGAMAGAIVLGLAGAVLGSQLPGVGCLDSENCFPARLGAAALAGVMGAVAGGAIGTVIGAFVPQWRTIYRYSPFADDYRYPDR